ncbi:hypothetical protein CXZ10_15245 [Pleomorphomonas diazotrophica]|uniref:Serine protease n=1 Tax=Pleomorphomonas diazotrophica TaxID=1166257 RepID=A0A1I4ULJ8_9HYPH|nr:serine protease [Pleomorphomonas diazotrophica]PKR88371.1 hypothetical protein CXZ10_15245 [Pleomorphomonas diazotrophica]SFM89879.1 Trypsin-like peptidase domain-containing protein [Pleomorphomonas diazotrophica]
MSSVSVLSGHLWLVAFLSVLSGPAEALDQDYFLIDDVYADEEKWTVGVNLARQSCIMDMEFVGNTELQVGKDASHGESEYYMMFANPGWSYEEGTDYSVTVKYDRVSTWEGDAVGMKLHAYRGVSLEGIKKDVIDEFGSRGSLFLRIGKTNHGTFNLSTTGKGVAALEECARAVADGSISLDAIAGRIAENGGSGTPAPEQDDRAATPPVDDGSRKKDGESERDEGGGYVTGTGFFVNGDGYLLTNAHVVERCEDAMVRHGVSGVMPAAIVARERTNDLAILKVDATAVAFGKFRGSPQIRLGDSVVVFGYPLAGLLSSTGNLSMGLVSALTGTGDDVSKLQISAPVQSGNSGGAVVDQSGHVVGIVVAKSNYQDRGTAEKPDIEVIQNANFAIKAGMAQFFLDANQVPYEVEPPGDDLRTPDVADIARSFTVQVICEIRQ